MAEATTRPSRTVWMPFTPSSDVPGSAGTTWPRVPNALSSDPDARSLITNSCPPAEPPARIRLPDRTFTA